MKVYLDDVRPKPKEFDVIVRTPDEAIELLKTGKVTHISLDYDLGGDGDEGEVVANWIEEQAYLGNLQPIVVSFHTDSSVGRERMMRAIQNAQKYWNKGVMR